VLIDANKLLRALEDQRQKLMQDTFTTPPADYASFQRAVGVYSQIKRDMALIQELARKED